MAHMGQADVLKPEKPALAWEFRSLFPASRE